MQSSMKSLAGVALLMAAATLPGCKDSTGSKAGPAAAVAIVGGNAQTGTVGAELPQPVAVKVTDAKGRPVQGQMVKFVVTAGGGHTFLGTATTGEDGVAQDRWTLGTVAGAAQTVEAEAVDPSTAQVLAQATFTATAAAGAPATLTPVGDTLVAGVAGTVVEDTFGVLVRDPYGNPVPGAQVAWSVQEGGGTIVTPAPAGANGVSRTQWVLGPNAGVRQRAAATLAGQTVRYTAGVATALNKVEGDGQTAGAGTRITMKVTASGPGLVAGLPVHWQVTAGGGTVTPAVSAAGSFDPAIAEWTLGPGGPQTLTASAGNLSVTFTATSIAQGQRTLLSTVPGLVLDATADRVAWQDNAGNIAVRTIATGADQFVRNDPSYGRLSGQQSSYGRLFSTGVVLWDTYAQLFDWHPGSLAFIGNFNRFSVDGDWLAWWFAYDTGLMLRHLTDRNTIVVPGTKPAAIDVLDVAPDGGVAYVLGRTLMVYRNGTTTPRYTAPQSVRGLGGVVLDGDNAVVGQIDFNDGVEILLVLPSGVESLGGARTTNWMAAGGWTAWSLTVQYTFEEVTTLWRRSPAGTRQRLNDPALGPASLQAISPNGSVAFRAGNPQTFFIVDAAGNVRGAGTYASGDRIVWHDGHFVLIHNENGTGSVYDLGS